MGIADAGLFTTRCPSWQKMCYSNNVLLNVLARSCKDNVVAIADAYKISSSDLLHSKNMFWDYFTDARC